MDLLSYGYAAVIALGGVIGFMKAGSTVSLAMGLSFGALSGYGAYQISQDPKNFTTLLVTSGILLVVMGYRALNSGKIMPSGLVAGLREMGQRKHKKHHSAAEKVGGEQSEIYKALEGQGHERRDKKSDKKQNQNTEFNHNVQVIAKEEDQITPESHPKRKKKEKSKKKNEDVEQWMKRPINSAEGNKWKDQEIRGKEELELYAVVSSAKKAKKKKKNKVAEEAETIDEGQISVESQLKRKTKEKSMQNDDVEQLTERPIEDPEGNKRKTKENREEEQELYAVGSSAKKAKKKKKNKVTEEAETADEGQISPESQPKRKKGQKRKQKEDAEEWMERPIQNAKGNKMKKQENRGKEEVELHAVISSAKEAKNEKETTVAEEAETIDEDEVSQESQQKRKKGEKRKQKEDVEQWMEMSTEDIKGNKRKKQEKRGKEEVELYAVISSAKKKKKKKVAEEAETMDEDQISSESLPKKKKKKKSKQIEDVEQRMERPIEDAKGNKRKTKENSVVNGLVELEVSVKKPMKKKMKKQEVDLICAEVISEKQHTGSKKKKRQQREKEMEDGETVAKKAKGTGQETDGGVKEKRKCDTDDKEEEYAARYANKNTKKRDKERECELIHTSSLVDKNTVKKVISAGNVSNVTDCNIMSPEEPEKFGQWRTAGFESKDRQQKFFRLLGGFKKSPAGGTCTQNGAKKLFASLGSDRRHTNYALSLDKQKELEQGLVNDFDRALTYKFNPVRGGGLGYERPSGGININSINSIQFDD